MNANELIDEVEKFLLRNEFYHPNGCQYCEMSSKPGPHPDCETAISAERLLRRIVEFKKSDAAARIKDQS